MRETEDLIRKLRGIPELRAQADALWNAHLAGDEEERDHLRHALEMMYAQSVEDYKQDKILLTPPSKLGYIPTEVRKLS